MVELSVDFNDELIRAMQEELESVLVEEKSDAVNAESDVATVDAERERLKKAMLRVLAASVRTQRLYFIVRSAIMSSISALLFLVVVWYLGTIDVIQAVFLSVFLFVASLILSRLFDKQIVHVSRKIVTVLSKHRRSKVFVLKNL